MTYQRANIGDYVDPNGPIDWSCSVNEGLVSGWLNLPNGQWGGGKTFRDLNRGLQNDGTLNNFSFPNTPTSGWQGPQGRPGGYGSLRFDGLDDAVVVPSLAAYLEGPVDYTIAGWLRQTSNTIGGIITQADAGNHIIAIYSDGTNADFLTYEGGYAFVGATANVSDGAWHHIVGTKTGTTGRVYLDGTLRGTGVVKDVNVGSTTECHIGMREGTAYPFPGYLDDLRVYSRTLSAAAVKALYDESRASYPVALRRVRRVAYSLPQVGGLLLARRRAIA